MYPTKIMVNTVTIIVGNASMVDLDSTTIDEVEELCDVDLMTEQVGEEEPVAIKIALVLA